MSMSPWPPRSAAIDAEGGAHGGDAGVAVLVDAVAEAHDLPLGGECVGEPGLCVVGDGDLVEHVHHRLVGAAVQRSFERADRGGDGAVGVGQGGGDDAGGEGGGVEAVLGVQDQRGLERGDDLRLGDLAEGHVEEVGGEAEVVAGRDRAQAVAAPLVQGDDRGQHREQPQRLGVRGGGGVVAGGGVGGAEQADGGAQGVHRVRGGRQGDEGGGEDGVQGALGAFGPVLGGELAGVRQFAVPQQVGDFLEAAPAAQFLDGIAAVGEGVGSRA